MKVGDKVKIIAEDDIAQGHIGTIKKINDKKIDGNSTLLILFDNPADEGWIPWLSDAWFLEDEVEAIENGS